MHSFKQKVKELKNKVTNSNSYYKIITKKNQLLDWVEVHPWKTLGLIYFSIVAVKIVLYMSVSGSSPYTPDAFVYTRMARSFFQGDGFQVFGDLSHHLPPLYPVAISPAFIFNDMVDVFNCIRIFNAMISTLIIFPSFLIAREFLNVKKSLFISTTVSFMAGTISYGFFALSENLFFPLFMFSVLFLYKSVFEKGYKFKLLTGFFVGLCILTRYVAFVLIPAILVIFITVNLFRNYIRNDSKLSCVLISIKNWFIVSIISGFTVLPWLIRNGSTFGYTFTGMTGYGFWIKSITDKITQLPAGSGTAGTSANLLDRILIQVMIHNGVLIISTGIIFFVLGLLLLHKSFKEKKIKLFTLGIIVFITAESLILLKTTHNFVGNANIWRLLARYVILATPLIFIFGYIALDKIRNFKNATYILLFSFIPLIFLSRIEAEDFFITFINIIKNSDKYFYFSSELATFFTANSELLIIVSFAILLVLFSFLLFNNKSKKIILILVILLIASESVLSVTKHVVKENIGIENNCEAVGKWLNLEVSGTNKIVIIDRNLKNSLNSFIGIWVNSPLLCKNVSCKDSLKEADYVVSCEKLDFPLAYQGSVLLPAGTVLNQSATGEINVYIYNLSSNI